MKNENNLKRHTALYVPTHQAVILAILKIGEATSIYITNHYLAQKRTPSQITRPDQPILLIDNVLIGPILIFPHFQLKSWSMNQT